MTHQPLSSAAQAVLATYGAEIGGIDAIMGSERRGLAAALRAAADQVVPVTSSRTAAAAGKRRARAELLSIAAELEALP